MKKTVYDIIVEKILKQVESGTPPWRSGIIKHYNGFLSREYQGLNQLLLSADMQAMNYSLPVWFSFKQVTQLGGSIRKGAKSSMVIFHKKITSQPAEELDDEAEEIEEVEENLENLKKQEKVYFMTRYYRVFNIDDVIGIDKNKYVNSNYTKKEEPEKLIEAMRNDGLKIKHGVQPCYIPSIDTVEIPYLNNFEKLDYYYAAMFHELIHSTGHVSRLNRKGISELDGDKHKYSYEELVAEIGSAFLMAEADLKVNYENSAAYLKGWSKFLQDHKKAIFMASAEAMKAAQYVVEKAKHKQPSEKMA